MNAVERVKSICHKRQIPISKLEFECGFSNGYISSLKKGTFPNDRLKTIADYLDVSVYYLMTGQRQFMSAEISESDASLLDMSDRMKVYALKMSELSPEKQDHIMTLIDMLEKS